MTYSASGQALSEVCIVVTHMGCQLTYLECSNLRDPGEVRSEQTVVEKQD